MNGPFAWPGGKRLLIKTLLPLIPEHDAYVEVFCGSAKLMFAKAPSPWEVINDINGDLINYFRVAKHRAGELAEALETELVASERFLELKLRGGGVALSEIDRALSFLYLTEYSFGGKGIDFAGVNIGHGQPPVKKSLERVRETLQDVSKRLSEVLIENRDWRACIDRYDSPETFLYLDPPYVSFGRLGRYKQPEAEMHAELMDRLARIKGKFLMSHENHELIRSGAKMHGFQVREVQTKYTLAGKSNDTKTTELVIANYKLPRQVSAAPVTRQRDIQELACVQ